jgi:hypothetical protein
MIPQVMTLHIEWQLKDAQFIHRIKKIFRNYLKFSVLCLLLHFFICQIVDVIICQFWMF